MSATRRRPDEAGRRALALYRDAPLSVRAHVTVRWCSAPFAQVVDLVPTGRIIEIGCGHGLFSVYAALQDSRRTMVGVDIDAAKITHAQAAGAGTDRLDFRVAESGAVPHGPWDAVLFVDVLYLLPASEQRRLLTESVAQLAPGGRLIIKDMGTEPAWKVRWNTVQETLSVKVLRITQGGSFDFVPPTTRASWLADLGLQVQMHRLDRRRAHPHHVIVGHLPGA